MDYLIIAIVGIAMVAFLYYYLVYRKRIIKGSLGDKEVDNKDKLQKQGKLERHGKNLKQRPQKKQQRKQRKQRKEILKQEDEDEYEYDVRDEEDVENVEEVPPMEPIITTKMKDELTEKEKTQLEELWSMCLSEPEKSSDMGLKGNTRIFMVWNPIGQLIGQAAILVIDEHDLQGSFSPIKTLGLDEHSLILYNVCVHPGARRQGIASNMLGDIHLWAQENGKRKILLFVKPDNQQAQSIYQKLGYVFDSANSNANNKGELQMTLQITG